MQIYPLPCSYPATGQGGRNPALWQPFPNAMGPETSQQRNFSNKAKPVAEVPDQDREIKKRIGGID